MKKTTAIDKTEVKAAEVAAEAVAETESKKASDKKTAAKKTTAKKATAKKTTAKKTTTKAAKKTTDVKVYFEAFGKQVAQDDILVRVEADAKENHNVDKIKSVRLYVKPEENTVYYVVNDKVMGDVYLF